MNTRLEILKRCLSVITFAQVTNTITKDENLISFTDFRGITHWDDEPDFLDNYHSMAEDVRRNADNFYSFFYGFASSADGSIHFDLKGHSRDRENYSGLGVITTQECQIPLPKNSWIVGSVINEGKGPHFYSWARCTPQEKLFAQFLLSGQVTFSPDELRRLYIPATRKNVASNHLINMAILVLERNVDHFLQLRKTQGGSSVDHQVFPIVNQYCPELWVEYVEKAHAQTTAPELKYSIMIPKPAPRPIVQSYAATKLDSVGLNTPFANLALPAKAL